MKELKAWEKVVLEGKNSGDIKSEYYWVDKDTGLMWQVVHEDTTYTWDEIDNASAKLNSEKFGGLDDWRVPTIDELKSILEENPTDGKYIKEQLVNSTKNNNRYWSSSTSVNNSYYDALSVYFECNDCDYNYSRSSSCYVRCVRGGK